MIKFYMEHKKIPSPDELRPYMMVQGWNPTVTNMYKMLKIYGGLMFSLIDTDPSGKYFMLSKLKCLGDGPLVKTAPVLEPAYQRIESVPILKDLDMLRQKVVPL